MKWAKRVWRRWTTKPVGHCSACFCAFHDGDSYSEFDGELWCKRDCRWRELMRGL